MLSCFQSDIIRQKADMGGGAAVIAAVGAVAELKHLSTPSPSFRPS